MPEPAIHLVIREDELETLCGRWRSEPAVGLDTEFFRERTYHPIPALVQVADDRNCWLIDLVALEDVSPLLDLLADERVVKVMHAPGQDLELFRLMGAARPKALYDTQTAAILAGLGTGPGYQSLVAGLLDVQLAKTETRSDWRRRPLSPAQQQYAAQDVAYLLPMKAELERRLKALGRTGWQEEECERLVSQAWSSDDAAGLRKLRQAWKLPAAGQELLYRLWVWREQRARGLDRPRQRVLTDATLQRIARESPDSSAALSALELPHGWIRRFGDEVLALAAETRALPEDRITPRFGPPVNRGPSADRLTRLRNKVAQLAETMNLPASFLVSRQTLESLAAQPPAGADLPPGLQGWRASELGDELLAALEEPSRAGQER